MFLAKKKYFILSIFWVLFSTQIFCQSLSNAQKYFDEGRLIEAKQQIDEYLTVMDTDVYGLILKSRIYYVLGSTKQYADVVANGKLTAIEALKKATVSDKNRVTAILKQEAFGLPLNIYNDLSNDGKTYFNSAAERKDKALFEDALGIFKKAMAFSSFLNEHNWIKEKIDSNNLFYAAKAAIYAGKEQDGVLYSKKIADNFIVKTVENKSFQPIYEWLVYYYRLNKNEPFLNQYTTISILHFPKAPYFYLNKIDWLREDKQYTNLVQNYRLLFSKGFKQPSYYTAYFTDMFNLIFSIKDSSINKKLYKKLFEKEIVNYIKKNTKAFEEMLLAGKYYRNLSSEMVAKNNIKNVLLKSISYLNILTTKKDEIKNNLIYEEALSLLTKNKAALVTMQVEY
jgi:hypothetical protein